MVLSDCVFPSLIFDSYKRIHSHLHILKQPLFDASEDTNNAVFVPPNVAETGRVSTR